MSDTHPERESESSAVEFRDVSIGFDGKPALTNITFELGRGRMIVVTGASQSGKSVLLHLTIGLLQPDSGDILIEGHSIKDLGETDLLSLRKHRMGMAFQEDSLFTSLSVYENTAYRLRENDWPEERIEPVVREMLTFVGLEEDAEKLPEELSVGMRRRLEIARALAGWPPIMLFDEPTSGLDPVTARAVLDLIIRAHELKGISVLCVIKEVAQIHYLTRHHIKAEADSDATPPPTSGIAGEPPRIMVLSDGSKVFFGNVDDFDDSDLPAVKLLTAPPPGAPITDTWQPDPWSRKKGQKSILDE